MVRAVMLPCCWSRASSGPDCTSLIGRRAYTLHGLAAHWYGARRPRQGSLDDHARRLPAAKRLGGVDFLRAHGWRDEVARRGGPRVVRVAVDACFELGSVGFDPLVTQVFVTEPGAWPDHAHE